MQREQLKEFIRQAEGWRSVMYADSVGIPTVGYGHNMLVPIPRVVGELLLDEDLKNAETSLKVMIPWTSDLDDVRHAALVEMVFNMGIHRVMEFKKMLYAVANKQWEKAATEMLDSRWARQVGSRAERLANWMRSGDVGGGTGVRDFGGQPN